ncbi:threonine-phosphate decarboxylase CobD [Stutzerimonas tarimensis]|uniref:threonine-phosphate decarboxylase n=1 Tax=Stutzerimonas tarimensis TaxID=1507735 RepID=A0ABV7T858_9GAMM
MLEHGGRLRQAAQRYGIPLADWLDLSTGIAPWTLPLPPVPLSAWSRLPEPDDGLPEAARQYYGTDRLLAVAGSQAAIQALPRLRGPSRVGLFAPAYAEHVHAWSREGHSLVTLSSAPSGEMLDSLDVLVVINPNNPTGERRPPAVLLDWHARLAERDGWMVVDEAFIDSTPEDSLAPFAGRPGLVVLRSFGKFFGLAGARLGFVLAPSALLEALEERLGPWTLSGPTRVVATALLADRAGQTVQRAKLQTASQRLVKLLRDNRLPAAGGCALFQWLASPDALALHGFLAQRGILVRHFETPPSLRLGLPADEAGWARLAQALGEWNDRS